ncbi:MAG: hypothetical protein ACI9U2_001768, partial [Bradymonadia bacterium]
MQIHNSALSAWVLCALALGCDDDVQVTSTPTDASTMGDAVTDGALGDIQAPDADDPGDAAIDMGPDGAPQCVPVDETCDGVDQDCDGAADEDLALSCWRGEEALRGVGRCADGQEVCRSGAFQRCEGEIGPVDELCNGVDDDCDGVTDEVTRPCAIGPPESEGVGVCVPGAEACTGGVWSGECVDGVGPSDDVCNGIDDDCDGMPDEGLADCDDVDADDDGVLDGADNCPEVFNVDQVDTDDDGAGNACDDDDDGDGALDDDDCGVIDPLRFPGADERCNAVDDDCDGSVDEALTQRCYDGPEGTDGVGACAAGEQVCDGGAWAACVGARLPGAEVCDGVDGDCDGVLEEGLDAGWPDEDDDGFGAQVAPTCPRDVGQADNPLDCDDAVGEVNPDAMDTPDSGYLDANCDGVDGRRDALIFVHPDADDALADGTTAAPFGTIEAALAVADPADQGLALAVGDHPAPVRLVDGVHLYGGYGEDWVRGEVGDTRLLSGGGADDIVAVFAEDIAEPTRLDHLIVESADATTPGASSYAVWARNAPGLRLRDVQLRAGEGADGQPGAMGLVGEDGLAGANGGSCGGEAGLGAASACGVTGGDGGRGGPRDTRGEAGQPEGCGGGGGRDGGIAAGDDGGNGCSPDQVGAVGDDGQPGGAGRVIAGWFVPGAGSDGALGSAGLPGGGGGGG